MRADSLGATPLDASQLLSGTVPVERIPVSAASRLLGRGAASAGAMEELTLGTGLTMTGTVLSAAGGGGDVVGPAGADAYNVAVFGDATGKLLVDSYIPVYSLPTTDAPNVWTTTQEIQPSLYLRNPYALVDQRLWVIASAGPDLLIQAHTDDAMNNREGTVKVSGDVMLQKAAPRVTLFNLALGLDERVWAIQNAGSLYVAAWSDDETTATMVVVAARTGDVTVGRDLTVNRNLTVYGEGLNTSVSARVTGGRKVRDRAGSVLLRLGNPRFDAGRRWQACLNHLSRTSDACRCEEVANASLRRELLHRTIERC